MKEETRVAGPWEFGDRPKVCKNKASVADARERRAELNQEIHAKGPIQAM